MLDRLTRLRLFRGRRRPGRIRDLLLAAVAAGVAGLGWWGVLGPVLPAAPAGADPAVNCSTGVIVAADFSPWGGNINSVCDASLPATAAEALVDAKFDPNGVAGYGLAFICQIAGDPPDDTCATTPPADAYWAFWYADAGHDTWTYSQSGAMSLEPAAGSVEAWVFGGTPGPARLPPSRHRTRYGGPRFGHRAGQPPPNRHRRRPRPPPPRRSPPRPRHRPRPHHPPWWAAVPAGAGSRRPPFRSRDRNRSRQRVGPFPPRRRNGRRLRPPSGRQGGRPPAPATVPGPDGSRPSPGSSTPPRRWPPDLRRAHPFPS